VDVSWDVQAELCSDIEANSVSMPCSSESDVFVPSSDEDIGSSGVLEDGPGNVGTCRIPHAYRIIDATVVGDLQVCHISLNLLGVISGADCFFLG
jgi:hypothetical protein